MAQEAEGQQALNKVLEVLTAETPQLPAEGKIKATLEKGAWEALSYLDENAIDPATDDLLEAVPDYYNFLATEVIIKLIDPKDYNQYGLEVKVPYRIKESSVVIYNASGEIKDTWQLLYLDESYMALQIGELRLFFTHTALQE